MNYLNLTKLMTDITNNFLLRIMIHKGLKYCFYAFVSVHRDNISNRHITVGFTCDKKHCLHQHSNHWLILFVFLDYDWLMFLLWLCGFHVMIQDTWLLTCKAFRCGIQNKTKYQKKYLLLLIVYSLQNIEAPWKIPDIGMDPKKYLWLKILPPKK